MLPIPAGEGLAFNTPTYPDPDNRFQYLGPGQVSASYRIVPNVTGVTFSPDHEVRCFRNVITLCCEK